MLRHSIKTNSKTKLTNDDEKIDINELKKKVINDYLSVVDSTSFVDTFHKELNYICDGLNLKIQNHKSEITKLCQIYLKAEWTRIKKETRVWPFSRYNEERTMKKLEDIFKNDQDGINSI